MATVAEITSGTQFTRSSNRGQVADSMTRAFKVFLSSPSEFIDIQDTCGVSIGDAHPQNTNIYCIAFDGRYDGDSRQALICTFQYASTPSSDGTDGRQTDPTVRPANWSVTSSLTEAPAMLWKPIAHQTLGSSWQVPANPVGDRYDGVMRVEPLVTFTVEQFESADPTRHAHLAGVVNSGEFKIGGFTAPQRSLMFRGVQCQPTVESWGALVYRGWKATYEFVYKKNYAGETLGDIGWDIVVPQTGFNVKAFAPPGDGPDDLYGQPLRHAGGKIVPTLMLPEQVSAGEKVRAMVKVFDYQDNGASQLPSAQPIPLNDNGRPRIDSAAPKVLVYRYQVCLDVPFSSFGLRLT